MSIKIQINSLEALERLIGNDNELEFELRNNVVQNFAGKHLKELSRNLTECHLKDIKYHISEEIKGLIGEFKNNCRSEFVFNAEVKKSMKTFVRTEIESIIKEHIEKTMTTTLEEVETQIKLYVNSHVQSLVKQKFEEAVQNLKL